jgi:hypothetical protein
MQVGRNNTLGAVNASCDNSAKTTLGMLDKKFTGTIRPKDIGCGTPKNQLHRFNDDISKVMCPKSANPTRRHKRNNRTGILKTEKQQSISHV